MRLAALALAVLPGAAAAFGCPYAGVSGELSMCRTVPLPSGTSWQIDDGWSEGSLSLSAGEFEGVVAHGPRPIPEGGEALRDYMTEWVGFFPLDADGAQETAREAHAFRGLPAETVSYVGERLGTSSAYRVTFVDTGTRILSVMTVAPLEAGAASLAEVHARTLGAIQDFSG